MNAIKIPERIAHQLADTLKHLVAELGGADRPASESKPDLQDPTPLEVAKLVHRLRLRRNDHFSSRLFGEPAWDMLLDLYINHADGKRVTVTSLCIAANVPATTALRHIQTLEQSGEVVRRPDPRDGRRHYIDLSDQGRERMEKALSLGR
jgi:DNA-binding MarR family transcriptional regulator